MRYTERPNPREINDVFDLIKFVFVSVVLAPQRLVNEISSKLMYLGKEAFEKLIFTAVAIEVGLLLMDCGIYLVTGKVSIISGFSPILVKFIALVVTVLVAFHLLQKFNYTSEFEEVESEPESEVEPEDSGSYDHLAGESIVINMPGQESVVVPFVATDAKVEPVYGVTPRPVLETEFQAVSPAEINLDVFEEESTPLMTESKPPKIHSLELEGDQLQKEFEAFNDFDFREMMTLYEQEEDTLESRLNRRLAEETLHRVSGLMDEDG